MRATEFFRRDGAPCGGVLPVQRRRGLLLSTRQTLVLIGSLSGLVIAFLWLAIISQSRHEREAAIVTSVRDSRNRVLAFERYVVRTLEAAELAARHQAEMYVRLGASTDRSGAPERITNPVAADPLFAAVTVVDADGDAVATTVPNAPPRNLVTMSATSLQFFEALRRGRSDRLVIGRPRMSPILGRPVVALGQRIDNSDGSFGGAVVVQIDVARFVAFAEGAVARKSDVLSAIRLDGITIARRTAGKLGYGEDLRGKLVMRMQMRNPNGTYLGPSALDGIPRYFSHRRLADYPIFVTSGVGYDEILAPARARAQRYYVGGALLTLASLALAVLLAGSALRRDSEARRLAEINERLRDAQRIGRIGDWEYDIAAGLVTWSDELCTMYRRDVAADHLRLDEAAGYFKGSSRTAFENAIAAAIDTGERQQLDLVAELAPGEASHRRLSIVPVAGAGGAVERLVGTDQDITPDKLHERLRAEVAHSARIGAINAMAATLAHELAQPLTAASNFLAAGQMMIGRGAAEEAAQASEALALTQRHLKLASEILRRARDMVSGRLQPAADVDLAAAVDDVFMMVAATMAPARADLVRSIDPAGRWVAADRVQLQQVLTNLVHNACDAAAGVPDRRVTVSSMAAADGLVTVAIDDNGPGLPVDFDEAMSPFASTKDAGLGLGLTIAKAIVMAHGGRLWFERSDGPGATVRFTVPVGVPAAG